MSTTIELVRDDPAVARIVFQTENGVHILSRAVLEQLKRILKSLKSEPALRVVVFESRGRTFLAGADLRELQALTRKSARKYSREGQRLFQRIAELPVVSISAIHAACVGGGLEMSLACDLRLAAESATMGFPEVKLGIIPGWGGTVRSTLLFGPAMAHRVILTGEFLPAAEALRLGLVNAVFPDAEFRAGVDAWITKLLKAAPSAAARAMQMIATSYAAGEIMDLSFLLDIEAKEFAKCYTTGEPPEGIAAFLEKRPATWAGTHAERRSE
jgi:enoyl-CoA hydratase/carnithine racemase